MRRAPILPVLLAAAMLAAGAAAAFAAAGAPLEVTGVLDVQVTTDEVAVGERDFRLGQAELDFAACTSDHSCACFAVAYDPATSTFGLGAATLEFVLAGQGSDCRHHYDKWERSGVVVGRFDVPFGIDWLVYPSVDRRTVSAPDVIGSTHGGWNEVGVGFFIEAPRYTLRGWLVNGFDIEHPTADGDPAVLATESGYGARASASPLAGLELGASVAGFATPLDGQAMWLAGADAQVVRGPWALKAEFIGHHLDFGGTGGQTHRGWYAQATRDLAGWHLFGRYDRVDFAPLPGGGQPAPDCEALVLGAGVAVAAPAELRLEYRAALDEDRDDRWLAQIVAGF